MTAQMAPSAERGKPEVRVVATLVVLQFVAAAGLTTIYLMLATLYREFAGHADGVGWVVTAYLLVAAISGAVCGRLGDLLGRRRLVRLVLLLCALGAIVSAAAQGLWLVVAGCALQGVAGALTPLTIGLAREHLPASRVPVVLGILTSAGMFGAGVAFVVAGFIVEHLASRGGFIFKVGVAVVALAMVAAWIPRREHARGALQGIDLWRGLLFAPALAAMLVAVQQGRAWGWMDPRVLGGLAGGAVLLLAWWRHQAAQPVPLINVRMLMERRLLLTNLATACVALGSVQLGQTFSLLLQQPAWTGIGAGLSPASLGWVMLPLNALSLVASPLSGRYGHRVGEYRAALVGSLACLAAWLLLFLAHQTLWQIALGVIVSTLGYAFLMPSLYNLIAKASPLDRASEAAGASHVVFSCFMAVGSQFIFALLATARVADPARPGASYPAPSAWSLELGYVAAMCLLCVACVRLLRPASARQATGTPVRSAP